MGSSTSDLHISPGILAGMAQRLHDLSYSGRVYSLSRGWSKPTFVTWRICSLTQDKGQTTTLGSSWKLLLLKLSWDMGT